ncbi:hypothetical protein [Streptococcus anginosus]|uniref:hypothetical protein n=1 Tax=Streptococcus anginosus TaxID=1328 RepID=UPI0009B6E990|nr:hypothetical protein [Streptococcus anginosus]
MIRWSWAKSVPASIRFRNKRITQLQQFSELLKAGNQPCMASHRDYSKHCFEVADKTCEASIKAVRFSSSEEHL